MSDDVELKIAIYEEDGEIKSRIQHGDLSLTQAQKVVAELSSMKRMFMDILDDIQQSLDNRDSEYTGDNH